MPPEDTDQVHPHLWCSQNKNMHTVFSLVVDPEAAEGEWELFPITFHKPPTPENRGLLAPDCCAMLCSALACLPLLPTQLLL